MKRYCVPVVASLHSFELFRRMKNVFEAYADVCVCAVLMNERRISSHF
jgi:hypothetical protein